MKLAPIVVTTLLLIVAGACLASSDIEDPALGFRKVYRNGYFEVICNDDKSSICSLTVNIAARSRTYELNLADYGYKRAWDPLGAFLIRRQVDDPISFYLTVDCSEEDYRFSGHQAGEVECSVLGRIAGHEAFLEQTKIVPICTDQDPIYRELESRKNHKAER